MLTYTVVSTLSLLLVLAIVVGQTLKLKRLGAELDELRRRNQNQKHYIDVLRSDLGRLQTAGFAEHTVERLHANGFTDRDIKRLNNLLWS